MVYVPQEVASLAIQIETECTTDSSVFAYASRCIHSSTVFALVFTAECDFNLKTIDGQWCIP